MINEEKVKIMDRLAVYEKQEGRKYLPVSKYYRSDYIGLALIKNFFLVTIGYGLILAVIAAYNLEYQGLQNENFYDVVVIGGGPAGLTAALYLARACYRVLVIEKEKFGGQITITDEVVNYPGVMKTSGKELTQAMQKQAEHFGAEFLLGDVVSLKKAEEASGAEIWETTTDKGSYKSFGILLATGAHPRMIGFPGEAKFRGHGVAYCATCDGEFFRGKEIFVVGGGFAAAEESVFLTKYAS